MAGTYPRTENDRYDSSKESDVEKHRKTLQEIRKSIDAVTKLPTSMLQGAMPQKLSDKDAAAIDARLSALRQKSAEEYKVQTFQEFCQRSGIATLPPNEQIVKAKEYATAAENHDKIRTITQVKFDLTDIGKDLAAATGFFKDTQLVTTFQKAAQIGVSSGFMSGIKIIDPTRAIPDDAKDEISRVKREMRDGNWKTPLLLNPTDRSVYIDIEHATPILVNNGGLFHEFFHAKTLQELGGKPIVEESGKETPVSKVLSSCEEVRAHIKTFQFMTEYGEGGKYGWRLFEKYWKINPRFEGSIDRAVHDPFCPDIKKRGDHADIERGRTDSAIEIAEAMATFRIVDPPVFRAFDRSVERWRDMIGAERYGLIRKLADSFSSAHGLIDDFRSSVSSALKLVGYHDGKRRDFRKFSILSLDDVVMGAEA